MIMAQRRAGTTDRAVMPPRRLLEFRSEDWSAGPGAVVGGDSLEDRVARWSAARSRWSDQNGGKWPYGILAFLHTRIRMRSWAWAVENGAPTWSAINKQSGPADPDAPPDDVHDPKPLSEFF